MRCSTRAVHLFKHLSPTSSLHFWIDQPGTATNGTRWALAYQHLKTDLADHIAQASLKERWRFVNNELEALHELQSQWTIPDATLRRNMKAAIHEDFVPLYKV